MPAVRTLRGSGRGGRFASKDDNPIRTRSGQGSKSAAGKGEKVDVVTPGKPTRNNTIGNLSAAKKATRSSSNISTYDTIETAAPIIYATCKKGILVIHGLPSEVFNRAPQATSTKRRTSTYVPDAKVLPPVPYKGYDSQSEPETSDESELDIPSPPPFGSRGRGRGRGGRGRGSRGRGGRGRGRGRGGGGIGGSAALARNISPVRTRPFRNAAPVDPLVEEDDEEPSNQPSPIENAKELASPDEDMIMDDASSDIEQEEEAEQPESVQAQSNTPAGTPPAPRPAPSRTNSSSKFKPLPVPRISLPRKSGSQTPQDAASTPADLPVRQLLNPEDDVLSDSDLPGPWVLGVKRPIEAECEDRADYLVKRRFQPMTDVQEIINSLTKYHPSQRSTENLYRLAENTQRILKEWQDEYLKLDARTAPHAHPPKKPCNGGRIPVAPQIFEDMKEADLYGYVFDPKKPPGCQDPFAQRIGREKQNGRELRQRRTRDMLDSANPSEEDEEEENEGRPSKRQRRATRKFEIGDQGSGAGSVTGITTPKRNGWGGARKRGVSKYSQAVSETSEPEGRVKRAKGAANALLHQRIQEMREESAVASSGDEGGSKDANSEDLSDAQGLNDLYRRRGRPAGSKNTGRRSDYGVKKGPRKKGNETPAAATPGQASDPAPAMLQSLSQGQGQFLIDPQPSTQSQLGVMGSVLPPQTMAPQQPIATVFQATPQPQDMGAYAPHMTTPMPDAYMSTTPLSGYDNPYSEDSGATPGSGSKRKPRVKSEKRSQSMTIWWAERKARQKELDEKAGKSASTKSTSSTGKRGSKAAAVAAAAATLPPQDPHRLSYSNPPPVSQDTYPPQHGLQPFSVASPNAAYATHPPPPPHHQQQQHQQHQHPHGPPPPQMMMQNSPLAALPSGPPPGPPHHYGPPHAHPHQYQIIAYGPPPPPGSSYGPPPPPYVTQGPPQMHANGPPPPPPLSSTHTPQPPSGSHPHHSPHHPSPSSSSHHRELSGSRQSHPPLAPAPLPPQTPQNYPSPYGPRTAPRPKSSGPPILAPAPAHAPVAPGSGGKGVGHVSPYPPVGAPTHERRVSGQIGQVQGEERRESRESREERRE